MFRRAALGALFGLPTLLMGSPVAAQEALPEEIVLPELPPEPPPAEPPYSETAEVTVLHLINLFRLEHGVRPLEWDSALVELARLRSADMAERNYFGHDIPGVGYGPLWLLDHLHGAIGTGENLGLSDERNETAMHSLFNAWVASPTHLENLVRPEFNRIGVGIVEIPTRLQGRTLKYVTQVFAIAVGPLSRV
jgi:uncharacterized protein YkwD